jgi:uncharacterized membrane protein
MDIDNDTVNHSIVKTLIYRLVGAVFTGLIVFAFTGKLALSVAVGTISLTAKTILYYLHDSLWAFIDARKPSQQQEKKRVLIWV